MRLRLFLSLTAYINYLIEGYDKSSSLLCELLFG